MTELFLDILNRSISASFLVLAILIARVLLRKGPKWANVLLWGLVAVRLLSPFTLKSALSLIPSAQTVQPEIMMSRSPAIDSGIPAVNQVVNPVLQASFTPDPAASANPLQVIIPVLSLLWGIGCITMALYCVISCWRLRRRVRPATRLAGSIFQSAAVPTPFVLGLFRPRIYLPQQLRAEELPYVIAHEKAHIRRGDHWWKAIGFAILGIHWFNPVMWLAYCLLCRDIEFACDERVIRELGEDQRADYSQALLDCSVSLRSISTCPLAFGETGVKARVKTVLSYKKPGFWLLALGIAAAVFLAVGFLTDPASAHAGKLSDIINQNGYQITGHSGVANFTTIAKEVLDADELAAGKKFGPEEVLVDKQPGCRVYLSYIGLSPENHDQANIVCRYVYAPYEEELLAYGELRFPYCPAMYDGEISSFMNQQAMYHADLNDPDFQKALKAPDGITVSTTVDASRIEFGESFTPLPEIEMYTLHYIRTDASMPLAGSAFAITDLPYCIPYVSAAPSTDPVAVQCRIDQQGRISLGGFLGGGENLAELGSLEEIALTQENFDNLFPTEFSAALFRENTARAWKCAWENRFVYLMLNKTSNVFLAYGLNSQQAGDPDTIQYLMALSAPSSVALPPVLSAAAVETTGADTYFDAVGAISSQTCHASADFLTEGGGYNFFDDEAEELARILKEIDPSDLKTFPEISAEVSLLLKDEQTTVNMISDWERMQITIGNESWCVQNQALTDFLGELRSHTPSRSTYEIYNVAPLEELPRHYNEEEASIDLCVIALEGDLRHNSEVWEDFLERVNAKASANVRLYLTFDENLRICDLSYDGSRYTLRWLENGSEQIRTFSNLLTTTTQDSTAVHMRFLLDNTGADAATAQDDALLNPANWQEDKILLFTEVIVLPKHPTIPAQLAEARLELNGQVLRTVTDPMALGSLQSMFSQAEDLGYEPKTYFLLPQLALVGTDGETVVLELDLDYDLCRIHSAFYDYGPGYDNDGSLNALPDLWKLLGLTQWPEEVTEAYN